jgi:hypothetical protein
MFGQDSWSCVKSCLSKYIRLEGAERQSFCLQIHLFVDHLSMIYHRGSLFFRLHLLRLLEEEQELPDFKNQTFYEHCLTIGITKSRKQHSQIVESYQRFNHLFPPPGEVATPFKSKVEPNRFTGDGEAIKYLARKMRTNFINHIKEPFFGRQFAMLKGLLGNKTLAKQVQSMINNYKPWSFAPLDGLPEEFQQWLHSHQAYFQTNERITKFWLEKNLHRAVCYMHFMQQVLDQLGQANFSIAPIVDIRSHFITIDNNILYHLMKNVKLFSGVEKTFNANLDQHWFRCFKIEKFSKWRHFGHIIETDGVSVIFKFNHSKGEGIQLSDNNHENSIDLSGQPISDLQYRRKIGCDPNRNTLLHCAEQLPDGSIREYKLSKKRYYHEGHINLANAKVLKWEQAIKAIQDELSSTTQLTPSSVKLIEYIQVYNRHSNRLWTHRTQKKYARNRMDTYIHKRQCLDRFFQSMQKEGEEKPIIAMGNAKFPSTGKGEVAGPTVAIKKSCQRYYEMIPVDEYRTTQMHHDCEEKLVVLYRQEIQVTPEADESVESGSNGNHVETRTKYRLNLEHLGREIRGLRWCGSTKCRRLVNRDLNAALNILRILEAETSGGERPKYLSRPTRAEAVSSAG